MLGLLLIAMTKISWEFIYSRYNPHVSLEQPGWVNFIFHFTGEEVNIWKDFCCCVLSLIFHVISRCYGLIFKIWLIHVWWILIISTCLKVYKTEQIMRTHFSWLSVLITDFLPQWRRAFFFPLHLSPRSSATLAVLGTQPIHLFPRPDPHPLRSVTFNS